MFPKKIALFLFLSLFVIFPNDSCGQEYSRRGLFVSVIQDPPTLSSRDEIKKLVQFAKVKKINILFVQIYRANQAWFPSKIADDSPFRECVKNVSEDPFSLLIKEAHASGIEVHAWLNMLSLSQNENASLLKKYGPGILTRNGKKKVTLQDYRIDDQYFLEPGDLRVRKELSDLVGEILKAYPTLDGIQFDYIRYPDKDPFYGYTKTNMDRFMKASGRKKIEESDPLWKNWRRDQVTEFLTALVKKTRSMRPNIQISATGCMAYSRAYHEAFQDWPLWLKRGLIQFVTVMSYSTDLNEFETYITEARSRTTDFKKVNIGIGAYEMTKTPDLFKRQVSLCNQSNAGGCVIFHYGSLLENEAMTEA